MIGDNEHRKRIVAHIGRHSRIAPKLKKISVSAYTYIVKYTDQFYSIERKLRAR